MASSAGPVVENDGAGNVVLKDPRGASSLRTDWTNTLQPRRP
jgi:hypothetical protein